MPVSGNRHHQRCPSQVGLEQLRRTLRARRYRLAVQIGRGRRDVDWPAGVHRTFTSNIVAVMVATTVAGSRNFEILRIACMYFHPVRSTLDDLRTVHSIQLPFGKFWFGESRSCIPDDGTHLGRNAEEALSPDGVSASSVVELRGIEPLTSSMRTKRATNCATAPRDPAIRSANSSRQPAEGANRLHRRGFRPGSEGYSPAARRMVACCIGSSSKCSR